MQGFVVESLCQTRLTATTQWKRINIFCPEANEACTLVLVINTGDKHPGISNAMTVVKHLSNKNFPSQGCHLVAWFSMKFLLTTLLRVPAAILVVMEIFKYCTCLRTPSILAF